MYSIHVHVLQSLMHCEDIVLCILLPDINSFMCNFHFFSRCCRFLGSSLISGEGLVSVGVASDAAKDELTKIHRENVQRLAGFSEEEILQEKERIEKTLGTYRCSLL